MNSNEAAISDCYAAQFAARTDAFAAYRGTSWVCVREPLTAAVIAAAWAGGPSVSGYTITTEGMTHIAALDFDTDDGLALARRVRATMAQAGVQGYVEVSRRGAHLWVLLDHPLPARTVRRALRAFLRDSGIDESPKIELRPSHDEIKPDGFGSPLRLPTMPHPKTGKRYPLLGPDDKPLSPRINEMLLAIEWTPAWLIESAAQTIPLVPSDAKRGDRKPYTGPTVEGSASDILRRLWGVLDARPNHTVKCPAHDDRQASLNILPDDERAMCMAHGCVLNNDEHGRGTYELTTMAPERGA